VAQAAEQERERGRRSKSIGSGYGTVLAMRTMGTRREHFRETGKGR